MVYKLYIVTRAGEFDVRGLLGYLSTMFNADTHNAAISEDGAGEMTFFDLPRSDGRFRLVFFDVMNPARVLTSKTAQETYKLDPEEPLDIFATFVPNQLMGIFGSEAYVRMHGSSGEGGEYLTILGATRLLVDSMSYPDVEKLWLRFENRTINGLIAEMQQATSEAISGSELSPTLKYLEKQLLVHAQEEYNAYYKFYAELQQMLSKGEIPKPEDIKGKTFIERGSEEKFIAFLKKNAEQVRKVNFCERERGRIIEALFGAHSKLTQAHIHYIESLKSGAIKIDPRVVDSHFLGLLGNYFEVVDKSDLGADVKKFEESLNRNLELLKSQIDEGQMPEERYIRQLSDSMIFQALLQLTKAFPKKDEHEYFQFLKQKEEGNLEMTIEGEEKLLEHLKDEKTPLDQQYHEFFNKMFEFYKLMYDRAILVQAFVSTLITMTAALRNLIEDMDRWSKIEVAEKNN